jgi:chaperonin GroEL
MPKEIIQDHEARQKLQKGITKLAAAVKSTLGPKGRNVMIEESFGSPRVTKDGVTVARHIDLEDKWENMGASLLKGAANQAMDDAGDGTTTATVLAEAIVNAGLKVVEAGNSPTGIRDGINQALKAVKEALLEATVPIRNNEDIRRVATLAANGDTRVGDVIAQAIESVGDLGYVVVDKGRGSETVIENHKGMLIEKGYASPHFRNQEGSMSCVMENQPFIFISNERIYLPDHIVPLLQYAALEKKPIVIIAPSVEGIALNTMLMNNMKGTVSSLAVNMPSFGDDSYDMAHDIATVVGSKVFDTKTGSTYSELENPKEYIGTTTREGFVRAEKDRTLIVGGNGNPEKMAARADAILENAQNAPTPYRKEQLLKRASKLKGGISKITAGGHSEAEINELYDRIDDALCAARAATVYGVSPGGGVALLRCRKALEDLVPDSEDNMIGINIIKKALSAPLYQIATNAGIDGSIIEMKILENDNYHYGWNALTGQYMNLYDAGVIDPTKVTITALETAASIAALVLTTNVTIAEIQTDKDFSLTGKHNPR